MWNEQKLQDLITEQIAENFELEYKAADALGKTDGKKSEISKDISALANSNGGVIIYGIREFNEKEKRHIPEKLDPILANEFTNETLDQIINHNIKPRIKDVKIHTVQLSSGVNHVAYVVEVPRSNTAHQSKSKKYYKRHNTTVEAMEDYEIRDLMNRFTSPDIECFHSSHYYLDNNDGTWTINYIMRNNSLTIAKDVYITIMMSKNVSVLDFGNFQDLSAYNDKLNVFTFQIKFLHYKINHLAGSMKLNLDQISLEKAGGIIVNAYSDRMIPRRFGIKIFRDNNKKICFEKMKSEIIE